MNESTISINIDETFINILSNKMKRTLSDRKQNMMIITKSMIDHSKILVHKWINDIRNQLIDN